MSITPQKSFAVVTGASQGLGESFAHALAKRNIPLILVSLPHQQLDSLATKLRNQYAVDVHSYETDFSSDENILKLSQWLSSKYSIHILINNAGTGGSRPFDKVSFNYINTIIQVNVKATSILTHQLLPILKQQSQSYILNVSSIAAFSPVGYKTVYPASKTFIHSFSIGLAQELKNSNVSVSVINPGAMKTNPEISERIEKQGTLGKLTLLDPKKVAEFSLNKMFHKETIIILNPISWFVSKLLPNWIKVPMMTRIIKREAIHE